MIEAGRYKKLTQSERICPLCKLEIEDETHFLLKCTKLKTCRSKLFDQLCNIVPKFHGLSQDEKFRFMMTNTQTDINTILILGISLMFDERLDLLNS